MNIFNLVSGYTRYSVETEEREGLIDLLKASCAVREIDISKGSLNFAVFFRETKIADKILSENCAVITYRKSVGIIPLINKYKKRYGLVLGVILVAALVLLSTFFVWEIRVEGNKNIRDDEIVELLNSVGFGEGAYKRGVNTEKIINKCLIEDDRISWMSINFEGTIAHIELRESRIAKKIEKKENVNLVASFDGIINRVDALSGMAAVSEGDVVTKGQILINAFVEKRTGGNSLRGAGGFVWAYTERSYVTVVPLYYFEKEYTQNRVCDYKLSFLGCTLTLKHNKEDLSLFDNEMKTEKMRLNSRVALPVNVEKNIYREYRCSSKRRTEKEALELAKEKSKKMLEDSTTSFTLVSCEDSFAVEENVLYYFCTFCGVENIAEELEFEIHN